MEKKSQLILAVSTAFVLVLVTGCDQKEIARTALNHLSETIVDDTKALEEQNWNTYRVSIHDPKSDGGTIRVLGRHLSGPPLDFVLLEESEYERLRPFMRKRGSQYRYNFKLNASRLNLTGDFDTDWLQLPNGNYVFIVDNSENFEANPVGNSRNDDAMYSITIKATNVLKQ